jgi:hypothetical protein
MDFVKKIFDLRLKTIFILFMGLYVILRYILVFASFLFPEWNIDISGITGGLIGKDKKRKNLNFGKKNYNSERELDGLN